VSGRLRLFFVIALAIFSLATIFNTGAKCAKKQQKKAPIVAAKKLKTEKKPSRIIVAYYFHGNVRCVSCKTIEAYSAEAVKTGFKKELKSGVLEWRVVNVEEKGNEHFIKDYQLYTKSLVLVEMKDGKQVRWKNLERVWDLLRNKEKFLKYVQDEARAYLEVK
jgi:hypothetical protein